MIKVTQEEATLWLRRMLLIRRFEEKCAELYNATKIRGFLHLYIGEEAVATGLIPYLKSDDAIVATYREHAHALLRGVSARAIMAEMFGKVTGCCKGRGGSMHIFDKSLRFYGGNAIVAGGLPLAVGLALADKMQKRKNVTVVFFGEGAMAEGEFHEAMNLAKLWKLPVLFACENNYYAMGTALSRSESQQELTVKAASYNMKVRSVDGMDLAATTRESLATINEVRESGNPQFIEFRTYRFRAHSMYDPDLYRDKAEVAEHQKADPILILEKHMREAGIDPEKIRPQVEASVRAEIEDAVKFAEESPVEEVSDLLKDVTTPVPLPTSPVNGGGVLSSPPRLRGGAGGGE